MMCKLNNWKKDRLPKYYETNLEKLLNSFKEFVLNNFK
jgi:hypothetical protein